jgi:putative transposase
MLWGIRRYGQAVENPLSWGLLPRHLPGQRAKGIFRDEQDRQIFLDKLALSLDIYHVSLLAYVCMANHFHLLVTTPEGNLSEFMRHFNISYTSAFNRRHRRSGHLYQGRYKAFLVDADSYLLEVSRYIHT